MEKFLIILLGFEIHRCIEFLKCISDATNEDLPLSGYGALNNM